MSFRALILASILLGLFSVSAPAQAPDPARRAAARELMEAAGVAKTFEQVLPSLTASRMDAAVAASQAIWVASVTPSERRAVPTRLAPPARWAAIRAFCRRRSA